MTDNKTYTEAELTRIESEDGSVYLADTSPEGEQYEAFLDDLYSCIYSMNYKLDRQGRIQFDEQGLIREILAIFITAQVPKRGTVPVYRINFNEIEEIHFIRVKTTIWEYFQELVLKKKLKPKDVNEIIGEVETVFKNYQTSGKTGKNEKQSFDKIDLWIKENIPNSINKESYKEIFEIVCEHPNPKNISVTDLLGYIHKKCEPAVGDSRLRQILPTFINSFDL